MFIRDSFSPIPASGKYLTVFDGNGPVFISLPSGVTAFGTDFNSGGSPSAPYHATMKANLVGGLVYTYDISGIEGLWNFVGVAFSQPIASLVFDDGGNPPLIYHGETFDNVTIGTVPEPSVLSLLGMGALFLCWRLRKRP